MRARANPDSLPGDVLGHCINVVAAGAALLGAGWIRRRVSRERLPEPARLRWLAAGVAVLVGGSGLLRALAQGPVHVTGGLRLLGLALAGLILGNLTGRALGLQRRLDAWGRSLARPTVTPGPSTDSRRADFCLGVLLALNPLVIPASIQDALEGRWTGLALKSALDAATLLSWAAGPLEGASSGLSPAGVARLVGPVAVWQAAWTGAAAAAAGALATRGLSTPLMLATDLLILCSAPAIAGIRGTPQANLLPTLLWMPILHGWMRGTTP